MIAVNIFLGLLFVGMGFLVKAFPGLIAGYNTMSKEKKAKVDIQGLSAYMRKAFIILGVVIIACTPILYLLPSGAFLPILTSIIFIGSSIIAIKSQQYDHNPKIKHQTLYLSLFFAVAAIILGGIYLRPYIPTEMSIEGERVEFSGPYGLTLNVSEIESIELTESIPPIKIRTNGLSIGRINKGRFRLEDWGVCRLFLESHTPLYIVIVKNDGGHIIINRKEKEETENTFRTIKELKQNRPSQSPTEN